MYEVIKINPDFGYPFKCVLFDGNKGLIVVPMLTTDQDESDTNRVRQEIYSIIRQDIRENTVYCLINGTIPTDISIESVCRDIKDRFIFSDRLRVYYLDEIHYEK